MIPINAHTYNCYVYSNINSTHTLYLILSLSCHCYLIVRRFAGGSLTTV